MSKSLLGAFNFSLYVIQFEYLIFLKINGIIISQIINAELRST